MTEWIYISKHPSHVMERNSERQIESRHQSESGSAPGPLWIPDSISDCFWDLRRKDYNITGIWVYWNLAPLVG